MSGASDCASRAEKPLRISLHLRCREKLAERTFLAVPGKTGGERSFRPVKKPSSAFPRVLLDHSPELQK